MSHRKECLQLNLGVGFGRWNCSGLCSQFLHTLHYISLSLLKHNQDPVSESKLGSVSALISLPIVPAYTGAEQEIKNS